MIFLLSLIAVVPGRTQNISAATILQKTLIIGTKETPPFAMKALDGTWRGISIDLWRQIAKELRLTYEFSERTNVQELLDGVKNGNIDIAVGALTITGPRARDMDFSTPFYSTGLGIAVSRDRSLNIRPLIKKFLSSELPKAIIVLLSAAFLVGLTFWMFERKQHEDFRTGVVKGVGSSVWWATATMTRRALHSYGPKTLSGQVLAILWMVTSVITIAVFTAVITSALTVKHLQGDIQGVNDLSKARVGATSGTSTQEALAKRKISYRAFSTVQEGLNALRNAEIDAFVYDKPLLGWLIREEYPQLDLLDMTFESQYYAFVLSIGDPLRHPLNVKLLELTNGSAWKQSLLLYLGEKAN